MTRGAAKGARSRTSASPNTPWRWRTRRSQSGSALAHGRRARPPRCCRATGRMICTAPMACCGAPTSAPPSARCWRRARPSIARRARGRRHRHTRPQRGRPRAAAQRVAAKARGDSAHRTGDAPCAGRLRLGYGFRRGFKRRFERKHGPWARIWPRSTLMRLRCAPSRGLRARRRCESRWAGAGAGACRRPPGRAQIARCWRWPPVCASADKDAWRPQPCARSSHARQPCAR